MFLTAISRDFSYMSGTVLDDKDRVLNKAVTKVDIKQIICQKREERCSENAQWGVSNLI